MELSRKNMLATITRKKIVIIIASAVVAASAIGGSLLITNPCINSLTDVPKIVSVFCCTGQRLPGDISEWLMNSLNSGGASLYYESPG